MVYTLMLAYTYLDQSTQRPLQITWHWCTLFSLGVTIGIGGEKAGLV